MFVEEWLCRSLAPDFQVACTVGSELYSHSALRGEGLRNPLTFHAHDTFMFACRCVINKSVGVSVAVCALACPYVTLCHQSRAKLADS